MGVQGAGRCKRRTEDGRCGEAAKMAGRGLWTGCTDALSVAADRLTGAELAWHLRFYVCGVWVMGLAFASFDAETSCEDQPQEGLG